MIIDICLFSLCRKVASDGIKPKNFFKKEEDEINAVINDLDAKLVNVLKKQEADYLKGYSIYVKQKEKDLKDIITRISANNSDNDQKDRKIFTL